MSWSRILNTPLAEKAKAMYGCDPRRIAHNWSHIQDLYWAAEHVYRLAYDENLDKAILTHDVIYDEHPEKEKRSALWLLHNCDDDGVQDAADHVMRTEKPSVTSDNRMILLDYARLRKRELILPDRRKILEEAMALNGITEAQFAQGSLSYFESVVSQFSEERIANCAEWEKAAFREIRTGMEFSIGYCPACLQ